jgi:hypothetical protein
VKTYLLPALLLLFGGVTAAYSQRIYVESAYYGAGGRGVDVTRRVQRLAYEGQGFRVSNRNLGIDPAPGRRKNLSVTYYVDRRRVVQRVSEDDVFYFRRGGYGGGWPDYDDGYRGTTIVRAVYGTRGRYADVTRTVRRYARRGESFRVSNDTFGVDPYKGRSKQLRVVFERYGRRFDREWSEGDRARF